jgi:hypothetical protein
MPAAYFRILRSLSKYDPSDRKNCLHYTIKLWLLGQGQTGVPYVELLALFIKIMAAPIF